jgi:hypothetical protein
MPELEMIILTKDWKNQPLDQQRSLSEKGYLDSFLFIYTSVVYLTLGL